MTQKNKASKAIAKQSSNGEITQTIQEATYEGALPMASEFREYNNTVPGAGDRLLTLVEQQQKHSFDINQKRHIENCETNKKIHTENMEKIKNNRNETRERNYIAGVLCLAVIGAGYYAMLHNQQYLAGIIFGGSLLTVVGKFIKDAVTHKKNQESKEE